MDYITEKDRIYAVDDKNNVVAEVTFPTSNGVSTINHTYVDASLRGRGIAGELVQRAVNKILSEGNKVRATCTYGMAWLKRHPEYL